MKQRIEIKLALHPVAAPNRHRRQVALLLLLLILLAGICWMLVNKGRQTDPGPLTASSRKGLAGQTRSRAAASPAMILDTFYGMDLKEWNRTQRAGFSGKDSLSFVLFKATVGLDSTDKDLARNRDTLRAHGLLTAACHVFKASDDPRMQALHYWTVMQQGPAADLAPVVIVQATSITGKNTNPALLRNNLPVFLKYLESFSHRRPMIYTDASFGGQYLYDTALGRYPLWLAGDTNEEPRLPKAWAGRGCTIRQKLKPYPAGTGLAGLYIFHGSRSDLVH